MLFQFAHFSKVEMSFVFIFVTRKKENVDLADKRFPPFTGENLAYLILLNHRPLRWVFNLRKGIFNMIHRRSKKR